MKTEILHTLKGQKTPRKLLPLEFGRSRALMKNPDREQAERLHYAALLRGGNGFRAVSQKAEPGQGRRYKKRQEVRRRVFNLEEGE